MDIGESAKIAPVSVDAPPKYFEFDPRTQEVSQVAQAADTPSAGKNDTSSLRQSAGFFSARGDIEREQVEMLKNMTPDDRKQMVADLARNSAISAEIATRKSVINGLMGVGRPDRALVVQECIIKDADKIRANALLFQLESIDKVQKKIGSSDVSKALEGEKETIRRTMAAPMMERAQMANILLEHQDTQGAKKYLQDAEKTSIPKESLSSPLVQNVKAQVKQKLSIY